MATSDDFKEKLRAGKIVDALTLALGEVVELEITTWVSESSSEKENLLSVKADQPRPDCRMRTRINIVDGDIENEVGSQFIGNGRYTELRQFHLSQVQEGRQIIQQNLDSLQQLFNVLTNTVSQMPQVSRLRGEENSALPPSSQDNLP
ncbi:MAG: hypothetical protein WA919_13170 [Coleofasciculaceae cyanobacterium]